MQLAPVCYICADHKRHPWSRLYGCVGAACQRVAHGRRFSVSHCKRHHAIGSNPSLCERCAEARAHVAAVRERPRGFGGGPGAGLDGTGAAWYDAEIYPGDTYPVLPRAWFERLAGGALVGPGWRAYPTQDEADRAALVAAQSSESEPPPKE